MKQIAAHGDKQHQWGMAADDRFQHIPGKRKEGQGWEQLPRVRGTRWLSPRGACGSRMQPTVEGEESKGAREAAVGRKQLETLGQFLPLGPGQASQICLRRVSQGQAGSRFGLGGGGLGDTMK